MSLDKEETQKKTKNLLDFVGKLTQKAKNALVDNEESAREEQKRKEKEEIRKRLEEEERQRRDALFRQLAEEEEQERLAQEETERQLQLERQRREVVERQIEYERSERKRLEEVRKAEEEAAERAKREAEAARVAQLAEAARAAREDEERRVHEEEERIAREENEKRAKATQDMERAKDRLAKDMGVPKKTPVAQAVQMTLAEATPPATQQTEDSTQQSEVLRTPVENTIQLNAPVDVQVKDSSAEEPYPMLLEQGSNIPEHVEYPAFCDKNSKVFEPEGYLEGFPSARDAQADVDVVSKVRVNLSVTGDSQDERGFENGVEEEFVEAQKSITTPSHLTKYAKGSIGTRRPAFTINTPPPKKKKKKKKRSRIIPIPRKKSSVLMCRKPIMMKWRLTRRKMSL